MSVEVVVSRPVAAPTPAGDTLTAAEGLLGSRSAGRFGCLLDLAHDFLAVLVQPEHFLEHPAVINIHLPKCSPCRNWQLHKASKLGNIIVERRGLLA